jgi:BirA family transcriptional regulator, biotin operon repressor / biotin---[acetyl-CoA-carboxylase] ligase
MKDNLRNEELPVDLEAAIARSRSSIEPFASSVLYYREVPSTMDIEAQLAAQGAGEGTTVIADAQTAGRGQHNHKWFSPPSAGLYVSVIIRPSPLSCLTMASGGLAQAIRASTGLPVEIKWPNDLVIRHSNEGRKRWHKIGGVLAETDDESPENIHHVILGFGINVHSIECQADIADRATSIEAELGRPVNRWELLVNLLASLSEAYMDLKMERQDKILSRWISFSPSSYGAAAMWKDVEVITQGVDEQGALLVRTSNGIERLTTNELNWT